LKLGMITLIPSATIKNISWQDAASGVVSIQVDVTIIRKRSKAAPADNIDVKITCPLANYRWLTVPVMTVTAPVQTGSFTLLGRIGAEKLNPAVKYALPLQFDVPGQIRTDKDVFILIVNPKQIKCVLPTDKLHPKVSVSAKLSQRSKASWKDMNRRIAIWPMSLKLDFETRPSVMWPEQVRWDIKGLDGVKVTTDKPIISQGRAVQVDIDFAKEISLDQLAQGKPIEIQIELRAINRPKTLILPSNHILAAQLKLPIIRSTRIRQKILHIGRPQWSDLTLGLVSVAVKLDIIFDGMIAPGTVLVLGLVPSKDIVKVEGVPVTVHFGHQSIDIVLIGRIESPARAVKWPIQLKPPEPLYGIRYIKPAAVMVSFTAPKPVQVVLTDRTEVLTRCDYHSSDPHKAVTAAGCVKLAGDFAQGAEAELRIKGLLDGGLTG
ncbi:MAG: hypothetical protein GTO60_07470, partial [Gammaproteobacteria bacterium]|nr:hypothetical protein [Gammaproteobacteria bacterium]